jgi:exoribonuclease R
MHNEVDKDAQQGKQEGEGNQEKALVPIQERRIDFHGDELLVVLVEVEEERQIYVPVRQFCDHLGLNWSAQYRRIERDEELRDTIISVAITATQTRARGYYNRQVLCLPLDLLPGFLFGVTPSRVDQAYRERVRLYRKKCFRVLWEAFQRGELFSEEEETVVVPSTIERAIVTSDDTRIDALTEQINNLTAIVAFLQEHRRTLLEEAGQVVTIVEAGQQELLGRADHLSAQLTYVSSLLEQLVGRQETTEAQVAKIDARTQRLTPAHARNVQGLVEKIVRESERRNTPGTALIHAHIYGRLKTHFRAGKFDEIPDERYPEVEAFLGDLLRQVTGGEHPMQGNLF